MDTFSAVQRLRRTIARRLGVKSTTVQLHHGRDRQWHAIAQQHASDKHATAQAALEDLLSRVTEREGVAA